MTTPFAFQPDEDGTLSLEGAVFQALGAASTCWSETTGGVFDSTRARTIGDALVERVRGAQ